MFNVNHDSKLSELISKLDEDAIPIDDDEVVVVGFENHEDLNYRVGKIVKFCEDGKVIVSLPDQNNIRVNAENLQNKNVRFSEKSKII